MERKKKQGRVPFMLGQHQLLGHPVPCRVGERPASPPVLDVLRRRRSHIGIVSIELAIFGQDRRLAVQGDWIPGIVPLLFIAVFLVERLLPSSLSLLPFHPQESDNVCTQHTISSF